MSKRWKGLAVIALAGLVMFLAASVTVAELGTRVPANRRVPVTLEAVDGVPARAVSIQAMDGLTMRGSLYIPEHPNGAGVMLLHGVVGNRNGMLGRVQFLLKAGYTCLATDSRAHGLSDGHRITWGVRETDDVLRWAAWMQKEAHAARLYGFGHSMGAAILLQTLGRNAPFRAIVAEAPFSEFRLVASERLAQRTSIHSPALLQPLVDTGFVYMKIREHDDYSTASPIDNLRRSTTPVLLIAGTLDTNVEPYHSRRLYVARPTKTRLWMVEGARHNDVPSLAPGYAQAILDWFSAHNTE